MRETKRSVSLAFCDSWQSGYFSRLKSPVRAEDAAEVLEAVLLDEDLPSLERIAELAADVRAEVALEVAAALSDEVSSVEMLVRAFRTSEELLVFTRFEEPDMRPLRNEDSLVVVLSLVRPLTLLTRVITLEMFVVLVRSTFPSALYWV